MGTRKFTRRQAITAGSAGVVGTMIGWPFTSFSIVNNNQEKLAILGGARIHQGGWINWPVWDEAAEKSINDMLRTGRWWRGNGEHVIEFEKRYADLMGVKRCLATASGTTALMVTLQSLGIDAGDEVLVSPYTFIASYNVIFMNKALPVFVDSNTETFLIDPDKIESRITERTTAILPVHIYGLPVDMDSVNTIAQKHNLKVVEDACQAWLGEYRGKKLGTLGDAGCFSFQNSKNLPAGEGGAIVSNNETLMDMCHSVHNCGRPFGSVKHTSSYPVNGGNYRMQQIQALILLSQMNRIEKDADIRLANARYLDSKLREIPGIIPYKLANGATRSAYHLYPFRYIKEKFNNVSKEKFIQALNAEGIPCKAYTPSPQLNNAETVGMGIDYIDFYQNILLGSRSDMEDIVNAITKIYESRDSLVG